MWTRLARAVAVISACSLAVAACGDGDSTDEAGATTEGAAGDEGQSLLWDNGACDEDRAPYQVGQILIVESPILTQGDTAVALRAAIDAFNARGGVGGHCMELTVCDSEADPNREVDCARDLIDDGIVAALSGVTSTNPQETSTIFEQAGVPRIGINASVPELASEVTYAIGPGSAGTVFIMAPSCTRNGHTQLAAIHVETAQVGPLFDAMEPMLDSYDAELVATIPVPAGTTNFQQFTLVAEQAGATCTILPLGENEAVQVLQAAQQLGTDMTFALSANAVGREDLRDLGDFADQLYLNSAIPPPTASQERWPILDTILADLEASGDPNLDAAQLKVSPVRSWLATYAFVRIIEDFGDPDDISREAVTAAVEKAVDVDMFGLTQPWTPSFSAAPGSPFEAISNPWSYVSTFDPEAGEFVVSDEQYNVVNELGGNIEYEQPGGTGGS